MSGINNWVNDKGAVSEKDKTALEKAKRLESHDLKNGYRWYKINERNKILVPCNEKGYPTSKGLEKIKRFKEHLGIK